MTEFDNHNRNQEDSRENSLINKPSSTNNVPEYNFWAEQNQGGAYSKYNPQTNAWEYGINHINGTDTNNKNEKIDKSGKKTFKFIMKAICFGLIAAISFIGFQYLYYYLNPDEAGGEYYLSSGEKRSGFDLPTKNFKIELTKQGVVQVKPRSVISEVVNDTMPSIVSIASISTESNIWFGQQYNQPREGSGSGIVVGKDENELLIATNNHVVAGTQEITVTFIDGKQAKAEIKGTDAIADLAVITVDISELEEETLNVIQIAKLGDSDQSKVGEMSIAIGNALGYGQSVTVGYISAKDREVNVSDGYESKTMILLQTDAAINPGNSGGALLNVNGEVIGINTVKYASNEVEGMGYAIPITKATPIINELMSREILQEEEQGFLGITGDEVTEEIAQSLNMPIGVFVYEVVEDGAADKAGLLARDIITKVNEVEITSITQLRDYVNSLRVGTEVKITYMRSIDGVYQKKEANVTLGINPNLEITTE